jgi:hypothetical protein
VRQGGGGRARGGARGCLLNVGCRGGAAHASARDPHPCPAPQVVSALGGVAGRLPDGTFGYLDGMTPEAVEAKGGRGL